MNNTKFRELLAQKGLSASFVCQKIGRSNGYFKDCARNGTEIPPPILRTVAKLLDTSVEYLTDQTDDPHPIDLSAKRSRRFYLPILGSVSAGVPSEAVELIEGYEEVSEEYGDPDEFACLLVRGDSMLPQFVPGDILIVHKQSVIESGEIGVVFTDSESSATVKRVQISDAGMFLVAANPAYAPIFITKDEIKKNPVRVWGRVVALHRKL